MININIQLDEEVAGKITEQAKKEKRKRKTQVEYILNNYAKKLGKE